MCDLLLSPTADSSLDKIKSKRKGLESRLVAMASNDSVDRADGLHKVLKPVKPWAMISDLSGLRKYRIGRHRFYIEGKHTDCKYIVQSILLNKRDEDDKPKTYKYQNMIRRALATREACITVDPNPPENDQYA